MTDNTLFTSSTNLPPLAARMRPSELLHYTGQEHIVSKGKFIQNMINSKSLFSLVLWGPPGTGKTTLARIIAKNVEAVFYELSAVSASVKDVREIIRKAVSHQHMGKKTLLFIDEIHRFNKSQQDALLHAVENGEIVMIGATTENPSFEVISPLLSRCRILKLQALEVKDLEILIERAIKEDIVLSKYKIKLSKEIRTFLIMSSGGDARKMYNTLDISVQLVRGKDMSSTTINITKEDIQSALQERALLYDKDGDYHYDTISAFIKSVRGSDPDAAVYWMTVMIEGGEDPLFIARRLIILASEDIGNADPRALSLAVDAWQAYERLGSPEGDLALAQAVVYLACAPKSNAVYTAHKAAVQDIQQYGSLPVPIHLRNAPTKLMKELGYGKAYKYAHDYPNAYVPGEQYVPDGMPTPKYYKPVARGLELKIKDKLAALKPQ